MAKIELEHIDKIYLGNKKQKFYALEDLSLSVNEGQVFVLLGPNGSGKTTVINIINGLLNQTNGKVSVSGMDPTDYSAEVKKLVATVPQETSLYNDLTARENLEFHADYYGVDGSEREILIEQVLDLVGLKNRQNDRVGTYSGGMQRRLSLARALLTNPEIILLDEPTLGVDVQSRNAIWNRIKELARDGKTIFITTNYMEEAEALADHIAIIDNGKNIIKGTLKELKNKIGQHRIILEYKTQELCDEAIGIIQEKYETEKEGKIIKIKMNDRKLLPEILDFVKHSLKNLSDFDDYEPTLNDVFLEFTGKNLRD